MTVSGVVKTEIQDVSAAMTSFDASAATGNVIVNTTSAGSNKLTTVKTGSGADKISVIADDLTANATLSWWNRC